MRRTTHALLGLAAFTALSVSAQAALETFNSATVGNNIGQVPGWYGTAGTGWATVNASGGVAGSQGISPGDQAFNWTAQTFDWTAMSIGASVTIGGDWQADANGKFNDDRMGFTTTATGTSSTYHFGTQLDNEANTGFVTYWKVGAVTNYTQIMAFPTITGNAWYRASTKFTKLGAAAAQLDVALQQLDASGNPTGALYTGVLADTSAVTSPAAASYFGSAVTPLYKSFNTTIGAANFDNAYYSGVVAVPEPASLSVLMLGGLLLGRRRHV